MFTLLSKDPCEMRFGPERKGFGLRGEGFACRGCQARERRPRVPRASAARTCSGGERSGLGRALRVEGLVKG